MAIITVNSKEVVKAKDKPLSNSELDKVLDQLKKEQKIIGSNNKEHSDEDMQDREDKRNSDESEHKDTEEELKTSAEDLHNEIDKADRESDSDDEDQKAGDGAIQGTGLSLTGQSRMAQLQHQVDDWVKKLLGRPLTKSIYDPSERSRRVPGLWGREVEEVIPKKGEKVLIVVLDLSGSIMSYAPLLKKALYTVAEKLAKGGVVTKVLLKNFDGQGKDTFLTIPQFKTFLRDFILLGTNSDITQAWNALKRDMKTLGRKIETISGLVLITDFQIGENFSPSDAVAFTVPKELGRMPILGIGVGGVYERDTTKFFNYNKGKDIRVIKITDDGKVQRVLHKEK